MNKNIINKIDEYLFDYDKNCYVNWILNNPLIEGIVLIPDLNDLIKTFTNNHIINMAKKCDDVHEFINILNNIFNRAKISFVYKPIKYRKYNAKILLSNYKIKIYVNDDFLYNYLNHLNELKNILIPRLSHELVHREQLKKINWSNYYVNDQKYNGNIDKHYEIMAYAKTIVDKLLIIFGGYKNKALWWLQKPKNGTIKQFDMYINTFGKNSKVIKQLYKYMYQYLININKQIYNTTNNINM